MKNIILIGFSGSGKSTIGPILAMQLKIQFYDLDLLIEKDQKKKIGDIFKLSGEKRFRELELVLLNKILRNKKKKLIALGGGAYQNREIRQRLAGDSILVYLSCSQRELYQRLKDKTDRPLLSRAKTGLKEQIHTMINKRKKNYQSADIIVSTTDKKISHAVTEIKRRISNYADC